MSGLEKLPASGLKLEQLPATRSPVSRETLRVDVSRPAPPAGSLPSPSENVTDAALYYGAFAPVSALVWPLGAVESAASVIVAIPSMLAPLVAVIERAPGAVAPELQL